jgi:hypothetical protein
MHNPPNPIHIAILSAVFAVIAFILQLGQRLGDWKSPRIAKVLLLIAVLLVACWIYLVCLLIFDIDIRTVFTQQPPVFWIIMATVALMGVIVSISPRWVRKDAMAMQVKASINIQVVNTWVVEAKGSKYPLKIRFQMKNAAPTCADVTMQGYQLNAPAMGKQVICEVLQLKNNIQQWYPEPEGLARVAVLPQHEFRGWIAANDGLYTKDQIERQIGNIGAVVLFVNGEVIQIKI